MATETGKKAVATAGARKGAPGAENGRRGYLVIVIGWLVPGAGHLIQKKWIRGALLLASVTCMFTLGLLMQGKLYQPNAGDLLDILGFLGDLGTGLLYLIAHVAGAGQTPVQLVTADYGTKFIVVAGLLNLISAVDAHNIAIGRKP